MIFSKNVIFLGQNRHACKPSHCPLQTWWLLGISVRTQTLRRPGKQRAALTLSVLFMQISSEEQFVPKEADQRSLRGKSQCLTPMEAAPSFREAADSSNIENNSNSPALVMPLSSNRAQLRPSEEGIRASDLRWEMLPPTKQNNRQFLTSLDSTQCFTF